MFFRRRESLPSQPNEAPAEQPLSDMPDFYEHMQNLETEAATNAANTVNSPENQEKLHNFNKLVNFFDRDLAIKEKLINLAPEQEFYGNEEAIAYADKLYEGFADISDDIKSIMDDFYPSQEIEDRLKNIQNDIVNSGANPQALSNVYRQDFSDLSQDFVDSVQKETIGYYLWRDPHSLDNKAGSVNEILHLMHSTIVNDNSVLQSLPVLAKNSAGDISLYGLQDTLNPTAQQIFDSLKDGEARATDIVSMKDRTIMMIRDVGHAMTMDIQKDADGKTYVNYFIPKICNAYKVNRLPGVRKVPETAQPHDSTTGIFRIDNDSDVSQSVINFINSAPTDRDIQY